MSNKGISGSEFVAINQDKKEVTGTTIESKDKRGLDIVPIKAFELITLPTPGETLIQRNEAIAVVKSVETDLITYMVPAGKILDLRRISCSGDNIALYKLYINGVATEDKRSWYINWDPEFDMANTQVDPGLIVRVTVTHFSDLGTGDFSATIKGVLYDE